MVAVVLTQPVPRVHALAGRVAAMGAQPVELTFSRLHARADAFDAIDPSELPRFDRIVFVSPSSVAFAAQWLDRLHAACPQGLAAVGSGTAAALRERLPDAAIIAPAAPPFDADALAALPAMRAAAIRRLLVLRGAKGREDWLDDYEAHGVQVTRVALYRAEAMMPSRAAITQLRRLVAAAASPASAASTSGEPVARPAPAPFADVWSLQGSAPALSVVSSVAIARSLLAWLRDEAQSPGPAIAAWLRATHCIVAHPDIADVLAAGGFARLHLPGMTETLTDAVVEWVAQALRRVPDSGGPSTR